MDNVKKTTICEGCDSEFTLVFKKSNVDGSPDFCPFCGADVSFVTDDLTDDDFSQDNWVQEEEEY